jgi:hypothetical protein
MSIEEAKDTTVTHPYDKAKAELVALLASRPRPAPQAFIKTYVDGLLSALQTVHTDEVLIVAELGRILGFLNKDTPFDYVNLACELALASWFKKRHPGGFAYQVPTPFAATTTGTQRTFDFQFHVDAVQYNVEVKNFSREWTSKDDQDAVKIFLPPDRSQCVDRRRAQSGGHVQKGLAPFSRQGKRPARQAG